MDFEKMEHDDGTEAIVDDLSRIITRCTIGGTTKMKFNTSAYSSFVMFGLLGNVGAVFLFIDIASGNVTVKNALTGATYTNSGLSITYDSATTTVTIGTSYSSNFTIIKCSSGKFNLS